jgi:small subunit ribosomal protein S17
MTTKKTEKKTKTEVTCTDRDCPTHGSLKVRGRTFKGTVVSKHDKRIAIELERMIYVRKYERYAKSKTKIHARLPACMERDVNIGDLVKISECRPLSKIIHFVVTEKLRDAEESK